MTALKEIIMGLGIGVGLFATFALGYDARQLPTKPDLGPKAACYEVVSIRPDVGLGIIFNVCTGQFGLSQFPSDIRRKESTGPAPRGSAEGAFLRRRPGVEI